MNAAEARDEMQAVIAALEIRLTSQLTDNERSQAIEHALREIGRIRKKFKHRIDSHAKEEVGFRGYRGFGGRGRAGIERKLAEVTEEAIRQVKGFESTT